MSQIQRQSNSKGKSYRVYGHGGIESTEECYQVMGKMLITVLKYHASLWRMANKSGSNKNLVTLVGGGLWPGLGW